MRFVVGNPIIMRQMVQHVPDADSYAPGNHSDRPASGWSLSLVRPDGDLPCSIREFRGFEVARDLHSRVEAVLTAAAK
jgi:hypothetical protein